MANKSAKSKPQKSTATVTKPAAKKSASKKK